MAPSTLPEQEHGVLRRWYVCENRSCPWYLVPRPVDFASLGGLVTVTDVVCTCFPEVSCRRVPEDLVVALPTRRGTVAYALGGPLDPPTIPGAHPSSFVADTRLRGGAS